MSAITDHGFRCASPAAIVVMTPLGSGNVKSRELLQKNGATYRTPPNFVSPLQGLK